MARRSAINAVAAAVQVTLDVQALRALAPGGVYRNRPLAQVPPFVSVGPCSEGPSDAFGWHYGAVVVVPVHVITSGADANGESRAVTILDVVMELLDDEEHLAVSGWQVMLINWVGTRIGPAENLLALETDPGGLDGVAEFQIQVRQL
ncbi:MAG TPA: hypothetical protein DCQ64_20065 [Candidatus Rokubacteria bacterium]|nr:hypothetical protein [Candidatus Rokubacteria bacterium]